MGSHIRSRLHHGGRRLRGHGGGTEIIGREAVGALLQWLWFETFDTDIEAVVDSVEFIIGNGEAAIVLSVFGTHQARVSPARRAVGGPLAQRAKGSSDFAVTLQASVRSSRVADLVEWIT